MSALGMVLAGGCSPDELVLVEPPPPYDQPGTFLDIEFIGSTGDTVMGTATLLSSSQTRVDVFRWTRGVGWELLGYPTDFPTQRPLVTSTLSKVVLDGRAAAGFVVSEDPAAPTTAAGRDSTAFRWTEPDGVAGLSAPIDRAAADAIVDISGDGSTVVGGTGGHAFRWTAATGTVDLGTLPGHLQSRALAVSADGQTVVGVSSPTALDGSAVSPVQDGSLFAWTPGGGMTALPVPAGMVSCETRPGLLSADGQTLFGRCSAGIGLAAELFRWDATGAHSLGPPPPFSTVDPRAMTPDGAVLVGLVEAVQPGGLFGSLRWTAASGLTFAAGPSGSVYPSFYMEAMNGDGTTVVGTESGTPVRWIDGGDVQVLPLPPGFTDGRSLTVSADGTIAAGVVSAPVPADASPPTAAAVWDAAHGVRLVSDLLQGCGLDARGVSLLGARVSADGSHLAGIASLAGQRPGLWIAPSAPSTCVRR